MADITHRSEPVATKYVGHNLVGRYQVLADLLVALKGDVVLIIEMKPGYSPDDEAKLIRLLTERSDDLMVAMRKFGDERGVPEFTKPEKLTLVLGLGFQADARFSRNPSFVYCLVSGLDAVKVVPPERTSSNVMDALKGVCT